MSIEGLRKDYHREICRRILGSKSGVPNLADVSSKTSKSIASGLIERLRFPFCDAPPSGQTVGTVFAEITMGFLMWIPYLPVRDRTQTGTRRTSSSKTRIDMRHVG
jgi:hypothetical protein